MKLELYIPVSPFHINQEFGSNPEYYSRFKDQFGNPFKGHNGMDLMATHGQPVYAPIDGKATYITDEHGGEGVIITTDTPRDYENGSCWFNVIHWHLIGDTDPAYPKPFQSQMVKTGDLIGYADNTGAPFESTGDHLHFGLVPVDSNQKLVSPGNGFKGCIDPKPYINGYFAKDAVQVVGILSKIIALLKQAISPSNPQVKP